MSSLNYIKHVNPGELVALGISVISVLQLTAIKQQRERGNQSVNLPLLLVTVAGDIQTDQPQPCDN